MAMIHAERALALVGTPFRPQGRDLAGLDCVGVVIRVFGLPANAIADDYRMRGRHLDRVTEVAGRYFRRIPSSRRMPGDLLLLLSGDEQLHFAVLTRNGVVHAHAGLRRVVETPGHTDWPLIGAFRRRVDTRKS